MGVFCVGSESQDLNPAHLAGITGRVHATGNGVNFLFEVAGGKAKYETEPKFFRDEFEEFPGRKREMISLSRIST